MSINNRELQFLLITSFRYCLGRRTGAVDECVGILQDNWDKLETQQRKQIHSDIRGDIKNNVAGDKCDVELWSSILTLKVTGNETN